MTEIPATLTLDTAPPAPGEYLALRNLGGLSGFSEEAATLGLPGSIFAVCLRQDGVLIGMGRIVGDGGCFFQVCDIVVHPDHQGRGLGKAIMTHLMDFAKDHLPRSAYLSLIADLPADQLYRQFGFAPTAPRSIGMAQKLG